MGTMMVWLPRLIALWSDGPAPPLRARPGPERSVQRRPSDCSSASSSGSGGAGLAARNNGSDLTIAPERSQRPGVDDEGVVAPVQQDDIEHVQRVDRSHALDQCALAVPVQRLQRKTAGVDLAALAHELRDLAVHGQMPGER